MFFVKGIFRFHAKTVPDPFFAFFAFVPDPFFAFESQMAQSLGSSSSVRVTSS